MRGYLLNRISQNLMLLVLVSIIGFAVLNLGPGGPLAQFALDPGMTQEDIARIAAQMGLDRPLPVQYWDWAGTAAGRLGPLLPRQAAGAGVIGPHSSPRSC